MKKKVILLIVVLVWLNGFSQPQDSFIKHTVLKGENITQIAQKYQVTPYDIYRLNPDSKTNLSVSSVLIIPVSAKSETAKLNSQNSFIVYEVKSQETLYGIAKDNGLSLETLEAYNPEIVKMGLQTGDVLKIPKQTNSFKVTALETKTDTLFHLVKQKETPFSVAKQYGISVQKLYELNPLAEKFFNINDKIIVRINKNVATVVAPEIQIKVIDSTGYLVLPKETMFGLTQKFGCTEAELIALNPELKDGLKEGAYLKIPNKSKLTFANNPSVNLAKSVDIYKKNKDLVLLIPFNVAKIEADSTVKIQDRLKKDLFLNMSLEVYSGALMAIDSAKKLGISMKIKILDSEETTNSNNIKGVLQANDFSNVGAIIGPFYPQHVKQTAQMVAPQNIPVFSPLRETDLQDEYAYETVVSNTYLRDYMFDFLSQQNENIIAAVDNTKSSVYDFLSKKQKVRFVPHTERGNIHVDSLRKYLKPNQCNYVILDSKKTSYILSLVNGLSRYVSDYDIKLVTLEKNDALSFEEINVRKLANLSLTYPSLTQDANYQIMNAFSLKYKKKYGSIPTLFAIRGFDITLDLMLRMSQKTDLSETYKTLVSSHIYNKFDFTQSSNNRKNQGVFIQQYQEDLTIKTINLQ